jgi:drug/metabolite transporter (DMT)-like permease
VLLVLVLQRPWPTLGAKRWIGALGLAVYMLFFTRSYLGIDTGIGELILFGALQVMMFAGALMLGEAVPARRVAGAVVALAGLAWLLWPGAAVPVPVGPALLMVIASAGWTIYLLVGRGAEDPLSATAASFAIAMPVVALGSLAWPVGGAGVTTTISGIALAVLSGAVTSGLGYALWYAILPTLGAVRAAVAQLTVPVIAALGGVLLLGEAPDLRLIAAGVVVLAGVALATVPGRRV